MKSEYKILWFEDQFEEVEGDLERIKNLVSEHGFVPDVEHKKKIQKDEIDSLASKLKSYNPYDLIIFDFDLGTQSQNGLDIASKLRNKIFTDMVFYSGIGTDALRKELFNEKIDGVFIIGRSDFYNDIEPIIEDHIKKISDINNMRGLIMSEVSKMDLELREIFIAWSGTADEENKEKRLNKLKDRLTERLEQQKNKINEITCIEEAVNDYLITTFDNIRVSLKDLLGDKGKETLKDGSLLHNIQQERNMLAHCKSKLEDGKMIVEAKTPKEYNFDEFKRLRKQIQEVHLAIKKLKE